MAMTVNFHTNLTDEKALILGGKVNDLHGEKYITLRLKTGYDEIIIFLSAEQLEQLIHTSQDLLTEYDEYDVVSD